MSVLMRTSELEKRPVVTLAGEQVAHVKDVVYGASGGQIAGFTLNGTGLFSGPLKTTLPWTVVGSLGRDAVMIPAEDVLVPAGEFDAPVSSAGRGDVIGSRVLTDDGTDLGKVVDVVVEVQDGGGTQQADVVGYEVEPSEALGTKAKHVYIPLPDTLAASGEHLMVPASAKEFVCDDLAGFGAAVADFRARLAQQQ